MTQWIGLAPSKGGLLTSYTPTEQMSKYLPEYLRERERERESEREREREREKERENVCVINSIRRLAFSQSNLHLN